MSRTYRKRAVSFDEYWNTLRKEYAIHPYEFRNTGIYWYDSSYQIRVVEREFRERIQYKTRSNNYYSYSLPQSYRNRINRSRRRKDKREIYKAIRFDNYEEQCSKWNCKDSDAWGYW